MAARHWAIGCGIGCGLVLVVIVGLFVAGALFVRDTTKGFETAVGLRETGEERFGEVEDYTPPPDGVVPPARMEAFLAVRDATSAARQEIADSFRALPMTEAKAREFEARPVREKLGVVFGAFGLATELGRFFEARNRALLDAEMGLGEYIYIYVLAYHSWLRHSPEDGPTRLADEEGDHGFTVTGLGTPPRLRDKLLAMLRNQLDGLPGDVDPAWRAALAAEIEAVEQSRRRLAWQDGLPPQIAAGFEPYRERLEALYEPVTNEFELIRTEKQGRFSYQAD